MALCVFVMISGVLFFGYIIASIAANLANADTQRSMFQEKVNGIKDFMDVSHRPSRNSALYVLYHLFTYSASTDQFDKFVVFTMYSR